MPDDLHARIRKSFDAATMMATLGARLVRVAPGEVEIRAPILPQTRQHHGFGHAGLSFSIGDTAAGYAAQTLAPPGHEVLTVEIKINLLAPAEGDELVAIGRVIRPGRRLIVVTAGIAALRAGVETQVAVMQGTMMPIAS